MENKKPRIASYITTAIIVIIAGFLFYFCWNLFKIEPAKHVNTALKSFDLKTTSLEKTKNPAPINFAPKSSIEGRANPFTPY